MQEDFDDPTAVTKPKRRIRLGCIGWILLVLTLGAGYLLGRYWVMPQKRALQDTSSELSAAQASAKGLEQQLKDEQEARKKLENERNSLDAEKKKAIADKERALRELESLKGELSASLEAELKSGDIGIKRRGRDIVLDVSDKVLFDTGKTEINERGRVVLEQVAKALVKLEGRIVQVGGHTDNMPVVSKDVRERFPTNWELSATRATNVVRFLQDSGKIPGERLMAAGFAEYRPVTPNKTETDRRKNRRIEIVLISPEAPVP